MEMSTIGMFFIRGQDISQRGDCSSLVESESLNLSEEDNTSCSASEMGCDLTVTPSSNSSSSRKNKRKNFKPRNILEYAGSDEEDLSVSKRNKERDRSDRSQYNNEDRILSNNNGINNNSKSNSNNNNNGEGEDCELEMDLDEDGRDGDMEDGDDEDDDENDIENDDEYCGSGNGSGSGSGGGGGGRGGGDGPLDLSEVQNDGKRLWRKPDFAFSSANNPLLSSSGSRNSPMTGFSDEGLPESINAQGGIQFPLGNGFLSAAMDLRLGGNPVRPGHSHSSSGGGGNNNNSNNANTPDFYEDRSNDLMISSTSSSNSMQLTSNNSSVLTDSSQFFESTFKELLGLYGMESLRQAGKPSPELAGIHRLLESSGQAKMMLPENMARFLAAMQEAAAASGVGGGGGNSSGGGGGGDNSPTNNSNHQINPFSSFPGNLANLTNTLNLTNVVQQPHLISSSGTDSQHKKHLLGKGNNSIFGGGGVLSHQKSASGKTGKSTVKPGGRGLSFPVIREGLLGKGTGPVDYTRYVRRYANAGECGYQHCRELNYREHFHCLDCGGGSRVFVKKEEMIRHFKWHKKRDESLQHGFMRYSPMDDCSDRFHNCQHNRKQTHYHCLKDGCEKVYISTSDVQMHANYHRKDSAIIQEGFQRFRAAEDCHTEHCTFRHQHTTHFHCRRESCSFTFKNKADMEKHKSYHVKDEQLNRDGFKKFMKHEACNYNNCRFSRVCNHIHCIREGCSYVLHSSGQLYSHKRKHERRDSELAYRKYKLAQSLMRGSFGPEFPSITIVDPGIIVPRPGDEENSRSSLDNNTDLNSEEVIKKYVQQCKCDANPEEHFHCNQEGCLNALLGTSEAALEHGKNHELEDRISALAFFTVDPANFDAQDSTIPCISSKCLYQTKEKHYHCLWDPCSEIVLCTDEPFKRLEHFRGHQYSQKLDFSEKEESMDGFFRRKRGRPPKDRVIEVSSGANEAIFTSFKLPPKPILSVSMDNSEGEGEGKDNVPTFLSCPSIFCPFNSSTNTPATCHYHCGHPRCHFSVAADVHKLSLHLKDFHTNVDILEGYEYFDSNSDCKESNCEYNGNSEHFHCTRDGFAFIPHSIMISHEAKFHGNDSRSRSNDDESDEDEKYAIGGNGGIGGGGGQIVKSSGIFYPLSASGKNSGVNHHHHEHNLRNGGSNENIHNSSGNNNDNDPMDLSSSLNGNSDSNENLNSKQITDHSLSRILQLPIPENGETRFGPENSCGRPFCKLKRKGHFHCHLCNQAFSEIEKLRPHVLKHNSFSPHKIENSDHSTDEETNNNANSFILKKEIEEQILNMKMDNSLNSGGERDLKGETPPSSPFGVPGSIPNFMGYPASHSPYLFLQQNPLTSLYANMFGAPNSIGFHPGMSPPPPHLAAGAESLIVPTPPTNPSLQPLQLLAGTKTTTKRPQSCSPSSPSSPSDSKKQRMQMRILKEEPVPDGYIRFRFNEDCAYIHCGYREHQTHFHCTREDCGYSFCDKTRFVQHTARHERLDTLMGGDFKQFRANVPCGRTNCSHISNNPNNSTPGAQNKASHFHCLKCDFVCTDTNKVVAHRRQHQKLDSINAAGFEKYTPSQSCTSEGCIHAQKQTHYHCVKCSYAVLGLSQMSAHKYRHAE